MALKFNPFTSNLDVVLDKASEIVNTPSGNLSATTVQGALNELQGDIDTINTDIADDVEGPASSTDNAIARFDGTTGKLLQNSQLLISDSGDLTGLGTITANSSGLTNTVTLTHNGAGDAIQLNHAGAGEAIHVVAGNVKLDPLTASTVIVTDASKRLASSSVSTTTLGYLDATSSVQTQLNAKQATITGAATTIVSSDLTVSRALVSDGSGKVAVATTTATEIGYVNGVTSAIQTQLNAKAASSAFDFTSGRIPYGTGSAYATNANLQWDNTNARLGIQTSSPATSLHLGFGQTGIRVDGTSDQTTNYSRLEITNSSTGTVAFNIARAGAGAGSYVFRYGGADKFAIDSNQMVFYQGVLAGTDNSYDLGRLSTSRAGFRSIYLGTSIQVGAPVNTTITAKVHIGAGTATASTAPLKFTAGVDLTTPENGAVEFDGTQLCITANNTRRTLMQLGVVSVSSNVTLTLNCIHFTSTASARNLTLPASPLMGTRIIIKDITGSANVNNITIVRAGSETIEGAAVSYVMDQTYQCLVLTADGSGNWWIV